MKVAWDDDSDRASTTECALKVTKYMDASRQVFSKESRFDWIYDKAHPTCHTLGNGVLVCRRNFAAICPPQVGPGG